MSQRVDWRHPGSRRSSRMAEAAEAAAAEAAASGVFNDWAWQPTAAELQRANTAVDPQRDRWKLTDDDGFDALFQRCAHTALRRAS
jgi:hypothetical protein